MVEPNYSPISHVWEPSLLLIVDFQFQAVAYTKYFQASIRFRTAVSEKLEHSLLMFSTNLVPNSSIFPNMWMF